MASPKLSSKIQRVLEIKKTFRGRAVLSPSGGPARRAPTLKLRRKRKRSAGEGCTAEELYNRAAGGGHP
jgi:hypothetical protein